MELQNFIDGRNRAAARRIIEQEMRAKWYKLSQDEACAIRGSDDLVRQLQTHYGIGKKYAQWEVENFLKGRSF